MARVGGVTRGLAGIGIGLVLLALAPSLAWAGNEAHLRTPVLWPEPVCGLVIDRGEQASAHFDYAIPFEDTMLGPEELPDSRTHQFVALCRQRPLTDLLPTWIGVDDVERSAAAGLVEAASVSPEQVLDTSASWAGCFVRITADDERRPITFAAAEAGIDWSLAEVPVGVWQLAGYTFEPPFNLWRARPGFVKILDDPSDPDQDLPAAAIAEVESVWTGPGTLELCLDARVPAAAIVEWSPFVPELDWRELGSFVVSSEGSVTLDVEGPPLAEGELVEGLIRVRLIDNLGREFVAHHDATIVFAACEGECGDPPEDAEEPTKAGYCALSDGPGFGGIAMLMLMLGLSARRASGRRLRSRRPSG